MDYQQFQDELLGELHQRYPEYEISIRDVTKNNGVTLRGLSIREPEEVISPTIYLEGYYQELKNGDSIGEIISEICRMYEKHKSSASAEDIIINIRDWDSVTERIYYTVVNKQQNEALLADIPYREMLDLAVVYRISISMGDNISGSALVRNEMMQYWGIDEDVLYKVAKENTPKMLGCELRNMWELMYEIYKRQDKAELLSSLEELESYMYVVSNSEKSYGAGVLFLNDDFRASVYERLHGDFIIIPSSIHETICIPYADSLDRDSILWMLHEVNRENVSPTEVLSENLYYGDENGIHIWV